LIDLPLLFATLNYGTLCEHLTCSNVKNGIAVFFRSAGLRSSHVYFWRCEQAVPAVQMLADTTAAFQSFTAEHLEDEKAVSNH
jgi:hypothetical protein